MPTLPAFTLTALGLDMQAQAELGGTLTFTRIALGAGAAADPAAATDLVDERMTENIQDFDNMGGGNVRLRAVFSNLALATGFGMSEVGVFALDPTTLVEKLHSYTSTATPDYMPPSTGPALLEQIFDAIIAIGTATSVTAVIDDTVLIATKEDAAPAILPRVVIGAGGAAAVDLLCASSGYDEISIVMENLFKQSHKAHLQADVTDGVQEATEVTALNAVVGTRTARAWLSRALLLPSLVGTCANLNGASHVAVQGSYAYVVNETAGTFSVVNISNPAAPAVVGTVSGLGANGVAVSGNYACVVNQVADTMSVIDVSTPTAPSVVGTLTGLNDAMGVAMAGNYAYVAYDGDGDSGSMSVVDISTPTAPAVVGTVTGLTYCVCVAVVGGYVYVGRTTSTKLDVISIANPAAPAVVGTLDGSFINAVAVVGNYAYATTATTMIVVDISTPATPTVVGTATGLSGARDIAVAGSYAYVANQTADTMSIIDISTPTAPVVVATMTGLDGATGVAVSGSYAYVANNVADTLSVIDVSTPVGGKLTLWPGDATGMSFEATMVTATGRSAFRATGRLPAWTTKLTISSLLAGGLLEGGSIVIRGRRLAV